MQKTYPNLFSYLTLTLSLLLVGCGSNKVFNANEALKSTKEKLTSPFVEIKDIEYSDTTKKALSSLVPADGKPFRISGTGVAEVQLDLYEQESYRRANNADLISNIFNVYRKYDIELTRDVTINTLKPKAYSKEYSRGEKIKFNWTRDVMFYNNPDTGKLDYKLSPIDPVVGLDYYSSVNGGFDISSSKGLSEMEQYIEKLHSDVIAQGNKLMEQRADKLFPKLSKDIILSHKGEYILLETPDMNEWKDLVPQLGMNQTEPQLIPFQITWMGTPSTHPVTKKVWGSISERGMSNNDNGYYVKVNVELIGEPSTEMYDIRIVPDPFTSNRSFYLTSVENMEECLVQGAGMNFVSYADKSSNMSTTEGIKEFNNFLLLHNNISEQTYYFNNVEGRDETLSFSVTFDKLNPMVTKTNRNSSNTVGQFHLKHLETGKVDSFNIEDIIYISSRGKLKVTADRIVEYPRDIERKNRYYLSQTRTFEITLDNPNQLEVDFTKVLGKKDNSTNPYKDNTTSSTNTNYSSTNKDTVSTNSVTQEQETFEEGNFPSNITILSVEKISEMSNSENPNIWATGTFLIDRIRNDNTAVFNYRTENALSQTIDTINAIGSIFGNNKQAPKSSQKEIVIAFPEGLPKINKGQGIIVSAASPLEVLYIRDNVIGMRSRVKSE